MTQHDKLAPVFDAIFSSFGNTPEDLRQEVLFLSSQIGKRGRVLDLGCGTGRHLVALARKGYRVVGVDGGKTLLGIAKKKLDRLGLQADLHVGDARRFHLKHRFDGVVCLWNSFAEITKTRRDARMVFKKAHDHLVPSGVFIIEQTLILPFDVSHLEYWLVHEDKDISYDCSYRVLKYSPRTHTSISENKVVVRKGKMQQTYQGRITQRWWTKDEFLHLAHEAGFSKVQFYGENYKPFNARSQRLMMVATK